MLKWLFHRRLNAFEREHGYDASYMHAVIDTDLAGVHEVRARHRPRPLPEGRPGRRRTSRRR